MNTKTILIGEDELDIQDYLDVALTSLGYSVLFAQDGNEVIQQLTSARSSIGAVLLDIVMPQKDGLETLQEIRQIDPALPVIIFSGASSPMDIATAMRHGATDFLPKPLARPELEKALSKALAASGTSEAPTPAPVIAAPKTNVFLGSSPRMHNLQSRITQIGMSDAPVLIQGETGSGKEVLARELHANSRRADKIFLKLNCAALPSELVESELFGYERGAFTGAFQKRTGMFEMANGGTLLLDEIGDMDVRLQAKLLQVLQDHEFQRIGGKEVVKVNVRIMAATHRNLEKAIAEGSFRADLYYRLNVINIELPPLRLRSEDIVTLAEFLLKKHANAGEPLPVLTPELKQAFLAYHWPGNVRELENTIRQLIALQDSSMVVETLRGRMQQEQPSARPEETALPLPPMAPPAPLDCGKALVWGEVKKAKRQAEANAIVAALDATGWNRKHAAAVLEIDYKALLYKMKTLGVVEDKNRAKRAIRARGAFNLISATAAAASVMVASHASGD